MERTKLLSIKLTMNGKTILNKLLRACTVELTRGSQTKNSYGGRCKCLLEIYSHR
jgi:hypothetical protein